MAKRKIYHAYPEKRNCNADRTLQRILYSTIFTGWRGYYDEYGGNFMRAA